MGTSCCYSVINCLCFCRGCISVRGARSADCDHSAALSPGGTDTCDGFHLFRLPLQEEAGLRDAV